MAVGEDVSRWNVIYPTYINGNRSIAQGRRIPKGKAPPEPRANEIKDVLDSTGAFKVVIEPKACFPRELDKEPGTSGCGRVRYQLTNSSDSRFAKKNDILLFVGESISKMKNRKVQSATGGGTAAAEGPAPSGGGGKSKKGKKR